MMKKLMLSLFVLLLTAGSINAQSAMVVGAGANTEQKKPHELTKITLLKLQSDLSITNPQGGKLYPVFLEYFTARANASEGLSTSEVEAKETQGSFTEIANKRDSQLETIFTAQQLTKWKQTSAEFLKVVYATK